MDIELNSTNIMTWCDGPWLQAYDQFMSNEGFQQEYADLLELEDLDQMQAYVNDSGNFETPQHQLVAICILYFMTFDTHVDQSGKWGAMLMTASKVFELGTMLSSNNPDNLIEASSEMLQELEGRERVPDLEYRFDMEHFHNPNFEDIGSYTLYCMSISVNKHEGFSSFRLFGETAYQYARSSEELALWTISSACAVRAMAETGLISQRD